MLSDSLISRNFIPSTTDPRFYYRHNAIIFIYTDDCIICSKKQKTIDDIIKSLHDSPENCDFTNDGDLKQYIGVDIIRNLPDEFELRQPFLIHRIIELVGLKSTYTKATLAVKPLLYKDLDGLTCNIIGIIAPLLVCSPN